MSPLERCGVELRSAQGLPPEIIAANRPLWEMGLGDWLMEESLIRRDQQYEEFLRSKRLVANPSGLEVDPGEIHPSLYQFQRDLTKWALRKGRGAIFADTGLGKTRMQIEWARLTGQRTLIVAPLAVARQTVQEAASIGVDVSYVRAQSECNRGGGQRKG